METKLSPCNGCGNRKPTAVGLDTGRHVVKCQTCGMNTGPQKNPTRATNLWNQNHRKQD